MLNKNSDIQEAIALEDKIATAEAALHILVVHCSHLISKYEGKSFEVATREINESLDKLLNKKN